LFKLNAMLADAASVPDGKLYMLGGGWSTIVAGAPFAVCGKVDIPWHLATQHHQLRMELVDGDGNPVLVPQGEGDEPRPIVIETPPFRPSIAPHVKAGAYIDWPFAVTIGPGLPLEPGAIYEWRFAVDGHSEEAWTLPFTTAPGVQMQKAA
jgi:hypothetical protein